MVLIADEPRATHDYWQDFLDGAPSDLKALDRWAVWQGTPSNLLNRPDHFPTQRGDPSGLLPFETARRYLRLRRYGMSVSAPVPTADGEAGDEGEAVSTVAAPGNPFADLPPAHAEPAEEVAGLAFAIDGSGIVCIDLEQCVRLDVASIREQGMEGEWAVRECALGDVGVRNAALGLLLALASYAEILPRQPFADVRVFLKGTLPDGAERVGRVVARTAGTVAVTGIRIDATGVRDFGVRLVRWWCELEESATPRFISF